MRDLTHGHNAIAGARHQHELAMREILGRNGRTLGRFCFMHRRWILLAWLLPFISGMRAATPGRYI
jgi:hypothetical protein